jgi:hypothetical protein
VKEYWIVEVTIYDFLTYVLMCGLSNMSLFIALNYMGANIISFTPLPLCILLLHNAVIPQSLLFSLWQFTRVGQSGKCLNLGKTFKANSHMPCRDHAVPR